MRENKMAKHRAPEAQAVTSTHAERAAKAVRVGGYIGRAGQAGTPMRPDGDKRALEQGAKAMGKILKGQ